MAFKRWECEDEYSYAFRLFSKHHTYMNSLYWAHVPASSYIQYQCRSALQQNPIPTTQNALNLRGRNAFRVAQSISAYSDHLKEFENWTRLNTLVSILSDFEIYLSSVVSLSIESDPGLLHSVSGKIDGAMVLKYNNSNEYGFLEKSELITKGTWDQRLNNFGRIFQMIPISLGRGVSDLEKMRKLRNSVAHAFGRGIDETRSRLTLEVLPIERLSESRLLRYMGLIRRIAKDIDNQLLNNHIGEFEMLHFYHSIQNDLGHKNREKELKIRINSLYVKNRSRSYCQELIDYYGSI